MYTLATVTWGWAEERFWDCSLRRFASVLRQWKKIEGRGQGQEEETGGAGFLEMIPQLDGVYKGGS